MRRVYNRNLFVNERRITKIVIDPHYEEKHASSVSDTIIMTLVDRLDGMQFTAKAVDSGFAYYATEPHFYEGKPYRLIWLLPEQGDYLGIVNCYRRPYVRK